jgi:iron complex transport system ATP-binding protein
MTLVVATHDLNMAASLCENLVLMHNGKILAQGLTQEVLTADMVRQLYGVEASVKLQSETGDLLIVPVRRKDTSL